MLISPKKLSTIWGLNPTGVLHIGAHQAEEEHQYKDLHWGHMFWVEANPKLYASLKQNLDPTNNSVLNCAAWDVDKQNLTFHETTDSQSSSLFELNKHKIHYPQILPLAQYQVQTRRIDALFGSPPPFTFVNIDVQGAELQVIRGIGNLISSLEAIYSEVNREELYLGCANVSDIDLYLKNFGFERVATRWILGKGWGDALYLNSKLKKRKSSKFLNLIDESPFYSRQIISRVFSKLRISKIVRKISG